MRRRDFPTALFASAVGAATGPAAAQTSTAASNGQSYPQTPAERAVNVEPVNTSYQPGQPERYIAPGFSYASGDGRSGTDFTAAINQALTMLGHPVALGAHNYLFSNLTIPATQQMIGQGVHQTNLICKPGSTGTMFTDRGGKSGAAKIDISGVAFYGNNCNYSHGLRLGYNTVQFGTEGVLDHIWVRDLPGGFPGIDINGNVGIYGFLISQSTGGLQLIGSAAMATQLECMDCKGFAVAGTIAVCNFGDAQIGALEVEAQAKDTTSVYLSGNTHLGMLTVSLPPGFHGDRLVEIGPSVRSWTVGNFKLYFQGAPPQLSGGNFKSGSNYFGGNATGASHDGEGNYSSGLMTQGDQFGFKMQQLNAFTLRVQNSDGSLEHMIGAVGSPTTPTNVAASVRGARSAATRTPTGPDASTAFAAGVKLGNPGGDTLILDTGGGGGQWDARDSAFSANVSLNTSGHTCTVVAQVIGASVVGESRRRLHLTLRDAASGAAVPWAAALARNGSLIDVSVLGFLR